MSKDKQDDLQFDSMPGSDTASEDDAKDFTVDLDFAFNPDEDDEGDDNGNGEDNDDAGDGDDTGDDDQPEGKETAEAAKEGDEEEEDDQPDGDEGGDSKDEKGEEGGKKGEEGDDEDGEVDDKPTKEITVPKSRLDQVLAKNRELQARLDARDIKPEVVDKGDGDKSQVDEYDFDAKELEYQNLVLEGESEKAVALRREIRGEEQKMYQNQTQGKTAAAIERERTVEAIQEAAARIEDQFPVFKAGSETYDEGLTAEVVELRNGLIASGKKPIDALNRAVEITVKMHNLDGAEAADPAPAKKKKTKSVKDKVATAAKQPDKLGGEGERTRKKDDGELNIETMTDDEWDALPEATRARLRGDLG